MESKTYFPWKSFNYYRLVLLAVEKQTLQMFVEANAGKDKVSGQETIHALYCWSVNYGNHNGDGCMNFHWGDMNKCLFILDRALLADQILHKSSLVT